MAIEGRRRQRNHRPDSQPARPSARGRRLVHPFQLATDVLTGAGQQLQEFASIECGWSSRSRRARCRVLSWRGIPMQIRSSRRRRRFSRLCLAWFGEHVGPRRNGEAVTGPTLPRAAELVGGLEREGPAEASRSRIAELERSGHRCARAGEQRASSDERRGWHQSARTGSVSRTWREGGRRARELLQPGAGRRKRLRQGRTRGALWNQHAAGARGARSASPARGIDPQRRA